MAKLVRGRWGRSNNEAVQRRAHNDGKEDDIQSVICRSRDHDITYL